MCKYILYNIYNIHTYIIYTHIYTGARITVVAGGKAHAVLLAGVAGERRVFEHTLGARAL